MTTQSHRPVSFKVQAIREGRAARWEEPLEKVAVAPGMLSRKEARQLTDQINHTWDDLIDLISRAWKGQAWFALGYKSWDDYCEAELNGLPRLSRHERRQVIEALHEELREFGITVRHIAAIVGTHYSTVSRALNPPVANATETEEPASVFEDNLAQIQEGAEEPSSPAPQPPILPCVDRLIVAVMRFEKVSADQLRPHLGTLRELRSLIDQKITAVEKVAS